MSQESMDLIKMWWSWDMPLWATKMVTWLLLSVACESLKATKATQAMHCSSALLSEQTPMEYVMGVIMFMMGLLFLFEQALMYPWTC